MTGLGLRIFGATDRGMARSVNEDRFAGAALAPDFGYGVVCDGVGGAKAGGVASTVARDEIRRGLEAACRPGIDQRSVGLMMESAISTANSLVYHRASQDPALLGGMGTTLCLAVVYDGGRVCIANVGDSRGYLLRGGELRQLTTDHTRAQLLFDRGEITARELERHPDRNRLTRAIGVEPAVEADYSELRLEPGDTLLLCSDGLYNMMDPVTLRECLRQSLTQGDAQCLIDAANAMGGRDNITAVIITLEDENG